MIVKASRAGIEHARDDDQAPAMGNVSYLLAAPEAREAWLVDPAWDVPGLLRQVEALGCELKRVLLTHNHADHAGGFIFGIQIPGIDDVEAALGNSVPVSVHAADLPQLARAFPGLEPLLEPLPDSPLELAGEEVRVLRTPGHTPGSVCYVASGTIFTGDTLFAQGCGRVDLPGGNAERMLESLRALKNADPELLLAPGHVYGLPRLSPAGDSGLPWSLTLGGTIARNGDFADL